MNFSQRMGLKPVSEVIQVDGMNAELRAGLWNVLCHEQFDKFEFLNSYIGKTPQKRFRPRIEEFSRILWADYFKLPVDSRSSNYKRILGDIRDYFFDTAIWRKVYDFIEFCVAYYGERIVIPLNNILKRELSGFRIIGGKVAPISTTEEVEAVQEAIKDEIFPGARAHLQSALDLLSRRTDPNYRNSIKESISAVESVCCALTGTPGATPGNALKKLAGKHPLHSALKEGSLKLYGYTSDSDGIRHAMLEETELTQADAVYFLISCSAFVNYLKVKMTE